MTLPTSRIYPDIAGYIGPLKGSASMEKAKEHSMGMNALVLLRIGELIFRAALAVLGKGLQAPY